MESRAQEALPAEVFSQLQALGTELQGEGIPADLVFNKALEGVAKRVPANRILPAVELYAGQLRSARALLGPMSGPPLLVAGADALRRGVPEDAVQDLGRREDRSPMALLVLAELVESGVSSRRALDVVGDALQMRARDEQMLDIPEQVRRWVRQGDSPQDAVDRVRRSLRRGGDGLIGPPVPPGSEPKTSDRARDTRTRRPGGQP